MQRIVGAPWQHEVTGHLGHERGPYGLGVSRTSDGGPPAPMKLSDLVEDFGAASERGSGVLFDFGRCVPTCLRTTVAQFELAAYVSGPKAGDEVRVVWGDAVVTCQPGSIAGA